jgi:hypothetical protein
MRFGRRQVVQPIVLIRKAAERRRREVTSHIRADDHQAIGVRIGPGPKQCRTDHRKRGSRASDPNRERGAGGEREPGQPAHQTKSVPDILREVLLDTTELKSSCVSSVLIPVRCDSLCADTAT